MKDAMKSKNEGVLRGLRAIKAEIIKAKTDPGAARSAGGRGRLPARSAAQAGHDPGLREGRRGWHRSRRPAASVFESPG